MNPRELGASEVWIGLGLLLLGGMIATGTLHVSHDVAVLAEVGERIVSGQVPYVDYVETNPPLSHYLNAGVAFVATRLGVKTLWAVEALAWLGTVVGAGALAWGARPLLPERGAVRAAAAFVGVSVFVGAVGNFAQREHLFVLLYLPFLVHRARVVQQLGSPGWGVLAGIFAAVGVCIKPHFVLTAGCVELALLVSAWRAGHLRAWIEPGFVAWALTGLLYPLHFLFLPESMRVAFFEVWMPVLVDGYRAYGAPLEAYRILFIVWLPVGIASFAALASREKAFGVAAVGAFLVYFVQWKGWFYHLVPAAMFAAIGVATLLGPAMARYRWVLRLCFAWIGVVLAVLAVRGNAVPDGGEARQTFEAEIGPDDRVLVWTTDLSPAYPWLALQGVARVGRYPVVFPLPVLFPDGVSGFGEPATEAERVFRVDLAADLDAEPDWILLDANAPCAHCGPGVSVQGYLEHIGLWDQVEREYSQTFPLGAVELRKRSPEPAWRGMIREWKHPEGLPDLPLIDGQGEPFGLSELADRWVLVGFVFTRCGNVEACPLTMQQMRAVQEAWTPELPELSLLTVTIDPEYDTPERLVAYGEQFGRVAEGPVPWKVATGDPELLTDGLPALFNILVLPEDGTLSHTVKLALLRPGLVLEAEWEGRIDPADVLGHLQDDPAPRP